MIELTKYNPGSIEAGGEHDHAVTPGGIEEGCIEVREIPTLLLRDVLVRDICHP